MAGLPGFRGRGGGSVILFDGIMRVPMSEGGSGLLLGSRYRLVVDEVEQSKHLLTVSGKLKLVRYFTFWILNMIYLLSAPTKCYRFLFSFIFFFLQLDPMYFKHKINEKHDDNMS